MITVGDPQRVGITKWVEGPREPGKSFSRKSDCENPDHSQNDVSKGFFWFWLIYGRDISSGKEPPKIILLRILALSVLSQIASLSCTPSAEPSYR